MGKFAGRRAASLRTIHRAVRKLCLKPLRHGVAACKADHYVKRYRSRDFALALLFYFILGLHSLRELHVRLTEDRHLTELSSMRGICNAQLANLLHDRPSALWAPLLAELLKRVRPPLQLPRPVWALDATFFALGCRLLSRITGRELRPENAGVKLSAVVDLDRLTPKLMHLSVGSGHDAEHTEQLLPSDLVIKGILFVFDRGYRKYQFFRDLVSRGADFITRASGTDVFRPTEPVEMDPAHPEIVSDQVGLLGGTRQEPIRLRRIVKRCEDDSEMVFLTTVMELSAADIAETYARRWDIEVFFRWLKRDVHLHRPLGYRTLNAGKHTVMAALVVYLLALLLADIETSRTTGKPVARIGPSIQRIRARLYQKPTRRELQTLGFP